MTDWTPASSEPDGGCLYVLLARALAEATLGSISASDERSAGPLELLALATTRLSGLALLLPVVAGCGEACDRSLVEDARGLAAQVVRLTVCALDAHACDAGYVPLKWLARGVRQAERALAGLGTHALAQGLWDCVQAIAAAIAASEDDLMAMPERLADAIAAALALYASLPDPQDP